MLLEDSYLPYTVRKHMKAVRTYNPSPWSDPAKIGVTARPDPVRTGFSNADKHFITKSKHTNPHTPA